MLLIIPRKPSIYPPLYLFRTFIIYFQTNDSEYNFSEIVIISDKNKMNFSEPIKLHNSQVRPIRIEYLVSV